MRTVRDIMQTDVISARKGDTLESLIQTLDEHQISGVPVLDPTGRVAGVVSRTDVLRWAAREREVTGGVEFWADLELIPDADPSAEDDLQPFFLAPESATVILPRGGVLEGPELRDALVEEIMTPVAFTVDPAMTIWELARFLVQGRIHRALVVEDGRLVGIATAFDVLRVVAGDAGV